MKRITAIELYNFLAFYGVDNKIVLGEGKNLLLYGENGSGKSSLCRALELFFKRHNLEAHRNIWALPEEAPTDMRVHFLDKNVNPHTSLVLDSATSAGTIWIEFSRLASGFLTYRDILKTHFLEENRRNLFNLAVNEILPGYKDPLTSMIFSAEWYDYRQAVRAHIVKDWGDPFAQTTTEDGEEVSMMQIKEQEWHDLMDRGDELEEIFLGIVQRLNTQINEFLPEFDKHLSVTLILEDAPEAEYVLEWQNDPEIDIDEAIPLPSLTAQVRFFNQTVPNHQTFLNEARLSALAICIFLAALRLKPDPDEGCKVLFLDDVLIGLDSGNRFPLFKILKTHFSDFQIFLSTYDRHWFELSKDSLTPDQWQSAEFYAKTVKSPAGNVLREEPKVVQKKDNISMAHAYFEQFDYPAAGNALRKECERILKNYMNASYLVNSNGSPLALGDLLIKITEYFEDAGQDIPRDVFSKIIFFKNALFNPASHHDLRADFYRREIEQAFDAVELLKNLPKISWTPVLHPNQELIFEDAATGFSARLVIGDYVYRTVYNGLSRTSKVRLYRDWWELNGIEFADRGGEASLSNNIIARTKTESQSLEQIAAWLQRYIGRPVVCNEELKMEARPLRELITNP